MKTWFLKTNVWLNGSPNVLKFSDESYWKHDCIACTFLGCISFYNRAATEMIQSRRDDDPEGFFPFEFRDFYICDEGSRKLHQYHKDHPRKLSKDGMMKIMRNTSFIIRYGDEAHEYFSYEGFCLESVLQHRMMSNYDVLTQRISMQCVSIMNREMAIRGGNKETTMVWPDLGCAWRSPAPIDYQYGGVDFERAAMDNADLPWVYGWTISVFLPPEKRKELCKGIDKAIKLFGSNPAKWKDGEDALRIAMEKTTIIDAWRDETDGGLF